MHVFQDSAPVHKAVVIQIYTAANVHDHITPNMWSPNSTDLNPLNLWSVVERKTNQQSHNTTDFAKDDIIRVMPNINTDHVTSACH